MTLGEKALSQIATNFAPSNYVTKTDTGTHIAVALPQSYNLGFEQDPENVYLTPEEFYELYIGPFEEPEAKSEEIVIEKIKPNQWIEIVDGEPIPKERMNSLRDKLASLTSFEKFSTFGLGVRMTPSGAEMVNSYIRNADGRFFLSDPNSDKKLTEIELKQKALLGEILHYFAFLFVYNFFMFYKKDLKLDPLKIVNLFFSEYKIKRYETNLTEEGDYDLGFILNRSAEKKYGEVEVLREKDLPKGDFYEDVSLASALEYSRVAYLIENLDGDFKAVVIKTFRNLKSYLRNISIKDDPFRTEMINLVYRSLFKFINYGQFLFDILKDEDVLRKILYQIDSRHFSISCISEVPIIINTQVQESVFFHESFQQEIVITNKRTAKEKRDKQIEACERFFAGRYSIDENYTIRICRPVKHFNIQFAGKADLVLFAEEEDGSLTAQIYDHKLSKKKAGNENVKLNAFMYKLMIGMLMLTRNIVPKDGEIMAFGINLKDEELRERLKDIVINHTRFYVCSLNSNDQNRKQEVLPDLSPWEFDEYMLKIQFLAETSILFGKYIKEEMKLF